jgi:hypothetical protein
MEMRSWPALLLLLACALAAFCSGARADSVETALMPGQVIQGHAKVESTCNKCHMRFNKDAQKDLCLECHKEVAKDVQARRGLHGRLSENQCRTCHTEHKGRAMQIAPVNQKTFDHAQTEFPLRGGHARPTVKCRDCHAEGKKFREAPSACVACHRKDDAHKGKLGEACANCHTERNWKEARFDHTKTHFPLNGKHVDVACKSCHVDPSFKGTPTECYGCHKKDDKHQGRFETRCETCHVDRGWKEIVFNHDRETNYPLRGKHRTAKCDSCHVSNPFKEKTPTTCVSCHKKDDKHKGGFGTQCRSCHVEQSWRLIVFNHDRDTKYPLRGGHRDAKCSSCHAANPYERSTPTACISCHQKDDKHRGQEGKRCNDCHSETSWRKAAMFDHGLTSFPLLGKHETVQCKKCHATPAFKDAETTCIECHRKDDKHKARLGADCASCHNARTWRAWSFDHNRQTHFRLDGGHERLQCVACHVKPMVKVSAPSACAACHDRDDVHDGGFGRACERCHVTSTFKRIKGGMGASR